MKGAASVISGVAVLVLGGVPSLWAGGSFWPIRPVGAGAARALARAEAAIGGTAAVRRVSSIVMRGRHDSMGSTGDYTVYLQAPSFVRTEKSFDTVRTRTQVMATDGASYWNGYHRDGRDTQLQVEDRFREQFRLYLLRDVSRFSVGWLLCTPAVLQASATEVPGREPAGAIGTELAISAADGYAIGRLTFDASGLPRRVVFQSGRPMPAGEKSIPGLVPAEWEYLDYRDVGGLRLAHRIVMRLDGKPYMEVDVQSTELNRPLPAALFHPGGK